MKKKYQVDKMTLRRDSAKTINNKYLDIHQEENMGSSDRFIYYSCFNVN